MGEMITEVDAGSDENVATQMAAEMEAANRWLAEGYSVLCIEKSGLWRVLLRDQSGIVCVLSQAMNLTECFIFLRGMHAFTVALAKQEAAHESTTQAS